MLDILAGRKKAGRVSGEVYVNGAPITNSPYWKRISGYVTQDDVLDPAFTVRETLRYTHLHTHVKLSAFLFILSS